MEGLQKAIEYAGGRRQLAELIGVQRQHVEYWLKNNLPPERALQIEEATGVHRSELLPELFRESA